MVEEQIRFTLLAEHELCKVTIAPANQEAFDSHLNVEQLNKVGFALEERCQTCDVADGFVARCDSSRRVACCNPWNMAVAHHL